MDVIYTVMFILVLFHPTLQNCPEEISYTGISVTWHETPTANNVESYPQCYHNETLITRNCSNSTWTPTLEELTPCLKIHELTSCPPGFKKVTDINDDYCYQIGEPLPWNYPCHACGGASVISDLSYSDVQFLMNSLLASNISRYFWVPAHRQKHFQPVVWSIPGPYWGQAVSANNWLKIELNFGKHCLLLDVERNLFLTETCTKIYPSLCFYVNNVHYPAKCPTGYHSFRFTPDRGACYGIAKANKPEGLSFNDFRNKKCNKPMSDNELESRFIFKQIAKINELPNDIWCWFKAASHRYSLKTGNVTDFNNLEGIINNSGVLGFTDLNFGLSCMACESEVTYAETELIFEYDNEQNLIYLSVYHPSGLWRYNENDKGFQCFSNAKGFANIVHVDDNPFLEIKPTQQDAELGQIEKIVYVINLVTDSSAQYWCEGHTVNFSLITTDKIIVNPRGYQIHVFSLIIAHYILIDETQNIDDVTDMIVNITTSIFNAQKVLIMDISDNNSDSILIVVHLHIEVDEVHEDTGLNILMTYNRLKTIAESELSNFNYTFVNLSSSVYCLPTLSRDGNELDWDMTPIGHIAAPKQFCLQSNGLPVKRQCKGSYLLGGTWGQVEGHCDNTYEPSQTTEFLYNFLKKPDGLISNFLTDGLTYVLNDTDIIIPADIYYLSMSLQQISEIAQENLTSIEATDIDHIAWAMNRVTILDCDYLRLAQTLNSTNVIVDSISDIIEIIAKNNYNETSKQRNFELKLAVEPLFVVQISYPESTNITGIAIVNSTLSDDFTKMSIHPLYKNTTLEEVLAIENLEIAAWLPTKLLDSIQKSNKSKNGRNSDTDLHVIITIYYNDAVFQEIYEDSPVIRSRIIGISIPEYVSNLEYPIPILFKQFNNSQNSFCGYWDFHHPLINDVPGSWKNQGCYLVKSNNDISVCECYHLTHFGHLFFYSRKEKEVPTLAHSIALNVITLVGSFLSLIGIVGIWITALIFSNWRRKAGTKVLLQLSTAIALPLIFIVIFILDYSMFTIENDKYSIASDMEITCIVLGALLHFSILASFMWMLITAVLQFIRYVRVLGVRRPSRFMIKFTLIGWGLPLFPVIITLALDSQTYIPAPTEIRTICYPSGVYLSAAVLLPICIILVINVALFISVLHAISRGSDVKMKSTDMDLVRAQLRVSIFLFFLLGLSWVFGIFSFSNNLLWSYLFCLTSTLQGFALFIYFIICDPCTRGLWVTLMTPQFTTNSSRKSVTSISAG